MQFKVITLLATAFATSAAIIIPPTHSVLNYDTRFDDPNGSLSTTECSADAGILHGHPTFGSIPNFPHIAGSFLIEGFNSTNCGACYELFYTRTDNTQVVLPFTIINSAPRGFISSVRGLNDLTGLDVNNFPGDVNITYRAAPSNFCGF